MRCPSIEPDFEPIESLHLSLSITYRVVTGKRMIKKAWAQIAHGTRAQGRMGSDIKQRR